MEPQLYLFQDWLLSINFSSTNHFYPWLHSLISRDNELRLTDPTLWFHWEECGFLPSEPPLEATMLCAHVCKFILLKHLQIWKQKNTALSIVWQYLLQLNKSFRRYDPVIQVPDTYPIGMIHTCIAKDIKECSSSPFL